MTSIDRVIWELDKSQRVGAEPWRTLAHGAAGYQPLHPASSMAIRHLTPSDGPSLIRTCGRKKEKESARRAVEGLSGTSRIGTEALAWYVSFHDDQRAWGIYIPLSSLALMDGFYLDKLPMRRDRQFHLASSVFLYHEQMHFAVDHTCAWFELMLRAPIRREFMARFSRQSPLASVKAFEAYLEVEETAANAHMLRQLRHTHPRQITRVVELFVEKQPAGYEGVKAIGDAAFTIGS